MGHGQQAVPQALLGGTPEQNRLQHTAEADEDFV
jgi:hypothetical protein